jgi:hypothetical protein
MGGKCYPTRTPHQAGAIPPISIVLEAHSHALTFPPGVAAESTWQPFFDTGSAPARSGLLLRSRAVWTAAAGAAAHACGRLFRCVSRAPTHVAVAPIYILRELRGQQI